MPSIVGFISETGEGESDFSHVNRLPFFGGANYYAGTTIGGDMEEYTEQEQELYKHVRYTVWNHIWNFQMNLPDIPPYMLGEVLRELADEFDSEDDALVDEIGRELEEVEQLEEQFKL